MRGRAPAHLRTWESRFRERLHCSRHSLSQRFNSTPFHSITPVQRSNRVRVKSFPGFRLHAVQCSAAAAIVSDLCLSPCVLPSPPISLFPFWNPEKRGSSQESASFFLASEVGLFLFFSFLKKILLLCVWTLEWQEFSSSFFFLYSSFSPVSLVHQIITCLGLFSVL